MNRYNDPTYLQNDQYKDASHLNSRIQLHDLFKTNPGNWFEWVFDHLILPKNACLLELGCGPGDLWRRNLSISDQRIPPNWDIHLSDFSTGMVTRAQQNLAGKPHIFKYIVLDAQVIPFPDEHFDAIIANHMFYHVPDRKKALRDITRCLKPGGRFLAATNGVNHMRDLYDLASRFEPDLLAHTRQAFGNLEFNLDNGAEQIATFLRNIQLERYYDSLAVTQAEPLADYMLSMASLELGSARETRVRLVAFLQQELDEKGCIHIQKDTGLFISQK